MLKVKLAVISILLSINPAHAKHLYKESDYLKTWCNLNDGIMEYKNEDLTRVDCLTKTHAVEFDFAKNWAEGVGQTLHYQRMTNKKGLLILILENPDKEMLHFKRIEALGKIYGFDYAYITPDVFR